MSTTITYQGALYPVQPHESALDALIRGGADVAASCRKGSCQTCLMRALQGQPPARAQRGLHPSLIATGHFLPCVAHPDEPLTVGPAERSLMVIDALVVDKRQRSPRVVQLTLEPLTTISWTPGQYLTLQGPEGLARSYSIASLSEQDYYVELHVGLVPGGAMSAFIHDVLSPGDQVQLQGPMGQCVYRPELRDRALWLLGSGTGIAPLVGVARDALSRGHRGPLRLIHAASSEPEAYLRAELEALAAAHPTLVVEHLIGQDPLQVVFDGEPDLAGVVLYLCGSPNMVYDARVRAVACGVQRRDILADPFEEAHPYWPRDREKLDAWPTQPELWQALERGPLLRQILTEFYAQVYQDARLSPFFQGVTMERAISKQYEFLYDVFTAEVDFFGLKPFNAHHWMVISDDLFDYREDLFEAVVRRHGVPQPLIRRWMALHELFRREIVKPAQRGMIIDGQEVLHTGYSQETLMMDMVCDGCERELLQGSQGRMHLRTGRLYCEGCAAKAP